MAKNNDGPSIHSRMLLGGYDRELERFGVQGPSFGRGGEEYRSAKDVEKDIVHAARNDYDLRETVSAAARSGKNKAIELEKGGFKNLGDVTNWLNFSEKAAKRHGQGGAFDSASDYMGLTKSMQIRDRTKQTEQYEKMFASQEDLDDVKSELDKRPQWQDYRHKAPEKSEELKAAEALVAEANQGPPSIYAQNNSDAPTSNTPQDAANGFLYDYRNKLTTKVGSPKDPNAGLAAAAAIVSQNFT